MTGQSSLARRALGETGLEVSALTIGTSPIGDMPGLYGYAVSESQAVATVRAVFDSEITFLDTSNGYGDAERRIGIAIAEHGGLPSGFVLATKADPDRETGDFSGSSVRRSVEESLGRLGLDHLQILHLHDPERMSFEQAMAPGGAVEAMIALKEEGIVDHLGVAGGPVDLMTRYVGTGAFELVLNHNRFTLIDQTADSLIGEAGRHGVAYLNAAPYGGGILSKGPVAQPKYAYATADSALHDRVRAMQDTCARYSVPIAAVALQFSLRDPRIASTVVGVSSPERVQQTLDLARWPIPDELWSELAPLISIEP
jgi:D-threo-aldose 1-dehydrogenase